MAEPKTSSVFVRLTRDFPDGAAHRRAGISLSAGPRPVEVEVTDEQLAALEGDRYIEIVSDKEAQKWEDRLGEAPLPTSADHPSVTAEGDQSGRNYGDGTGEGEGGDEGDEEEDEGDGLDDLKFDQLKALAGQEEVSIDGLNSKDQVREAIRAKRADNSSSEE